jgi:hypothetical protein
LLPAKLIPSFPAGYDHGSEGATKNAIADEFERRGITPDDFAEGANLQKNTKSVRFL